MEYYRNVSGASGVLAYEVTQTQISVKFSTGWIYVYDYLSAGVDNVEHMKTLAINGTGLNSFINRRVKNNFTRKFK